MLQFTGKCQTSLATGNPRCTGTGVSASCSTRPVDRPTERLKATVMLHHHFLSCHSGSLLNGSRNHQWRHSSPSASHFAHWTEKTPPQKCLFRLKVSFPRFRVHAVGQGSTWCWSIRCLAPDREIQIFCQILSSAENIRAFANHTNRWKIWLVHFLTLWWIFLVPRINSDCENSEAENGALLKH